MEPAKAVSPPEIEKLESGDYLVTFADGVQFRMTRLEVDRGQDLLQTAYELRARAGL